VFEPYRAAIRSFNRRLSEREVDAITSSILLFSERYDVDPRLVMALMIAESSFNPNVTSHKGAMGLGQLMPAEANRLGLTNPYDPVQNIAGSIYLLRGRLDKYSGGAGQQNLSMQHIILALASYNAGMGAVKKYKGVPPYRETRNYVKKVERIYRQLCGSQGGAPS
jgi:soluble lytic murein transglycosylase-like protein